MVAISLFRRVLQSVFLGGGVTIAIAWPAPNLAIAQVSSTSVSQADQLDRTIREMLPSGRVQEAVALVDQLVALQRVKEGPQSEPFAKALDLAFVTYYAAGDPLRTLSAQQELITCYEALDGEASARAKWVVVRQIDMNFLLTERTQADRNLFFELTSGPRYRQMQSLVFSDWKASNANSALSMIQAAKKEFVRLFDGCKIPGDRHWGYALWVNAESQVQQWLGQNREAIASQEQAVTILEALTGPANPLLNSQLSRLGYLYLVAGNLDLAELRLRQALRSYDLTKADRDLFYYRTMGYLFDLSMSKSDYGLATTLMDQLMVYVESPACPDFEKINMLSRAARLADSTQRYQDMVTYSQRALQFYRPTDHETLKLRPLSQLGFGYLRLKQWDQATASFEALFALAEKLKDIGWQRNSLAYLLDVSRAKDDTDATQSYLKRLEQLGVMELPFEDPVRRAYDFSREQFDWRRVLKALEARDLAAATQELEEQQKYLESEGRAKSALARWVRSDLLLLHRAAQLSPEQLGKWHAALLDYEALMANDPKVTDRLKAATSTIQTLVDLGMQDDLRIAKLQVVQAREHRERKEFKEALALFSLAARAMDQQWVDGEVPMFQVEAWLELAKAQRRWQEQLANSIVSYQRAVELAERARGQVGYSGMISTQAEALAGLVDAQMWHGQQLDVAELNAKMLYELRVRQSGSVSVNALLARRAQAEIYLKRANYEQAIAMFKECLDLHSKLQINENVRGIDITGLGVALSEGQQWNEAEGLLRDGLKRLETFGEKYYWEIGRGYNALGNVCAATKRADESMTHYRRTLKLWESIPSLPVGLLNVPRESLGRLLAQRAYRLEQQGDPLKANVDRQEVLAVYKAAYGAESPTVKMTEAWIRSNERWAKLKPQSKAEVDAGMRELTLLDGQYNTLPYDEVIKTSEKLIKVFRPHLGENDLRSLLIRQIQFMRAISARQFKDAFPYAEAALKINRHIKGADDSLAANVHYHLGLAYWQLGKISDAGKSFERSTALWAESKEVDFASFGSALNQLARCRLEEDLAPQAMEPIARGTDYLQARVRRYPGLYLGALATTIELYTRLGDLPLAEHYLKEANQLADRAKLRGLGDENLLLRAETRLMLAAGKMTEAEDASRRWLEMTSKGWGQKSGWYREALRWKGLVLCRSGQFDLAVPVAQQTVELAQATPGMEIAALGQSLLLLGEAKLGAGDLVAAREATQQAVLELEKNVRPGHERVIAAREQLARIEWSLGNEQAARTLRLVNLSEAGARFEELATVTSDDQLIVLASSMRQALYDYLALPPDASSVERVYDEVLRWKGAAFAKRLSLRAAIRDPKNAALVQRWRRAASILATNALRPPYTEQQALWFEQLGTQRKEFGQLDAQLSRLAENLPPVKTSDVQASLPEGSVLIDMVAYPAVTPDPQQPGTWLPSARFAFFIVRPSEPVVRVDIADREAVTDLVEKWRTVLQEAGSLEPDARLTENLPQLRTIGQQLRSLIWEPIQSYVQDAPLVILSPDGALASLPFGALPGSDPKTFLIEEKAFMVVPAPRLLATKRAPSPHDSSLLVFGQVDYGAKPGSVDGGRVNDKVISGGFSQLTYDHIECGAVLDNFKKRFPDSPPEYITKTDATEGQFRKMANQYRWVHVSTHGFFREDYSIGQVIHRMLPPFPGMTAAPIASQAAYGMGTLEHPGLQCGIGLAGANQINQPGEDDGVLSALEVSTMDLSDVDGIVLSACQTALGSIRDGEGVMGLQRAFHQAGAPSVMATYWSVPVIETINLLNAYYESRWVNGHVGAIALQSAQSRFARQARLAEPDSLPAYNEHPYYWAGFSLSSDSVSR